MIVSRFSAGCSSFAATYMVREKVDKIIYIHIDDQHSDTMRFVKESEILFGKPVEILQSHFKTVEEVCMKERFLVGPKGARCTKDLKRKVGDRWQYEQKTDQFTFVWGYDKDEKHRADKMEFEILPQQKHLFPLIDADMTKTDAHQLCWKLGIKQPEMYSLGYPNNNCIGCLKGGMGYWNKIRVDFPEVFAARSRLERDIGASIIHTEKDGEIYLDELGLHRGWKPQPIEVEECGLFCQMAAL